MPDEKTNKMLVSVGVQTSILAENLIRQGFQIGSYADFNGNVFKNIVSLYSKCNNIDVYDSYYRIATWEKWQDIITMDWGKQTKWLAELGDCDNFAFYFSSRMAWLYRLNSCGVAIGHRTITENGVLTSQYHAWNVLLANMGDGYKLLYLEPQTNSTSLVDINGEAVINGWKYGNVEKIIFF